ncbi:hypothetical protein HMPREF1318_0683 [Actinomyces massiliensis F0489]|uniref:Uncharacterized protein n=1 Tax=Actinomyces massiliensis F0489 TaxID=1125718 RepID=J0NRN0_9ACTO|nr:hypothetical protein HMPREF1318_0683 [Actinomyces massiliensis F0489]
MITNRIGRALAGGPPRARAVANTTRRSPRRRVVVIDSRALCSSFLRSGTPRPIAAAPGRAPAPSTGARNPACGESALYHPQYGRAQHSCSGFPEAGAEHDHRALA